MSSKHSPFRALAFSRWWKPTLIIALGGLLAFMAWTVPNWMLFREHVAQFPALWQVPENRRAIISLTIKVFSPLLVMEILGTLVWIASLISPLPKEMSSKEEKQKQVALPTPALKTLPPLSLPPGAQKEAPKNGAISGPSAVEPEEDVQVAEEVSLTVFPDIQPQIPETEQALLPEELPGTINNTAPDVALEAPRPLFSQQPQPISATSNDPLLSICLLKDVTVRLLAPDGRSVVVPLTLNAKRVQLFAYIAWRRGELIDRDKILEHVFGWGLSDEEATEEKLSERFESHKKLLRKKIRDVALEQINTPAGKQVIPPDFDPFVSDAGFWGLSPSCRVDDLEQISACYKVIAQARKEGLLVDEIPVFVKQACDELIKAYSGDFLESLIKKFPAEFGSWQGRSSWVRKPYTLFRDYYLDALWYAAEYEWRKGQQETEINSGEKREGAQRKQQEYYGRAAQLYQTYAMYACNSKFDAKATFGTHGEYGERVGMSERALRRCVVLLGAIGRTDLVNQVWSAYLAQMKLVSEQRWQPSKETLDDVQAAKAQTNAYRFANRIAQLPSEFRRQPKDDIQDRAS